MGLFFQNEDNKPTQEPASAPSSADTPQERAARAAASTPPPSPWRPETGNGPRESKIFVPYDFYVQTLGANPDIQGLTFLDAKCERAATKDGSAHFIWAKMRCKDGKKPRDYDDLLVYMALYRFKRDIPFAAYRKNAERYTIDDFELVESGIHLTKMMWNWGTMEEHDNHIFFYAADFAAPLSELTFIEDGIYLVALDVGGARMTRDARVILCYFGEEDV